MIAQAFLIYSFILSGEFAILSNKYARVVELVDTLALGASASGREGSSPFSRTMKLFGNYLIYYKKESS